MAEPRSILVAVDGSPESAAAVRAAVEIAKATDAPVTVATVLPPPPPMFGGPVPSDPGIGEMTRRYRDALERAVAALRAGGVATVEAVFLEGPVVPRLVEFLKEHPTRYLVVGSRGLSGPARFVLGSTSEGLVHHAGCSVLVVRSPPPVGRA